jgi:hypothetical protein
MPCNDTQTHSTELLCEREKRLKRLTELKSLFVDATETTSAGIARV